MKPQFSTSRSASIGHSGSPAALPVEIQLGYLKKLPPEYGGERHVVTPGRAAEGTYRWEERRGASPASEDSPKSIFRIFLVRAKDGQPDYSWPEDVPV